MGAPGRLVTGKGGCGRGTSQCGGHGWGWIGREFTWHIGGAARRPNAQTTESSGDCGSICALHLTRARMLTRRVRRSAVASDSAEGRPRAPTQWRETSSGKHCHSMRSERTLPTCDTWQRFMRALVTPRWRFVVENEKTVNASNCWLALSYDAPSSIGYCTFVDTSQSMRAAQTPNVPTVPLVTLNPYLWHQRAKAHRCLLLH